MTASRVVANVAQITADVAPCAEADIPIVENAIRDGGAGWVSAIIQSLPCVSQAVTHIIQMIKTADASGRVLPLALSPELKRRVRMSFRLYRLLSK